jgi:hypothetical protein
MIDRIQPPVSGGAAFQAGQLQNQARMVEGFILALLISGSRAL